MAACCSANARFIKVWKQTHFLLWNVHKQRVFHVRSANRSNVTLFLFFFTNGYSSSRLLKVSGPYYPSRAWEMDANCITVYLEILFEWTEVHSLNDKQNLIQLIDWITDQTNRKHPIKHTIALIGTNTSQLIIIEIPENKLTLIRKMHR